MGAGTGGGGNDSKRRVDISSDEVDEDDIFPTDQNVVHSADLGHEFQKFGTQAFDRYEEANFPPTDSGCHSALRQLASMGFTGETYYDFDKGLDKHDPIVIIHFNDVYNIEESPDGTGGISRFSTAFRQFRDLNPLILFSGDAFNPSMISAHTRGRHMVPFLNMLKVHTACVGNHDFDFGIDHLEYLMGSTQFPWLLSNVFDSYFPERPLAGALLYRVFEWQGHRVGIMGLVEKEWLATLSLVQPEDVVYRDFVEQADELSAVLRSKECELIIALTHMRSPNDERLAREAKDIDIILGGHDHDYYGVRRIRNTLVAKSGTDFREFTALTIYPGSTSGHHALTPIEYDVNHPPKGVLTAGYKQGGAFLMPRFAGGSTAEWQCVDVTPDRFPPNRHVDKLVNKYISELEKQMHKILGEVAVDLETRFCKIRTEETNVGNWLTDLMRESTKSDIAVLNSGTVRSDCIIKPGAFRLRDLTNMLPMPDLLVVVAITGRQLLEVLENSVCQFPRTEGRFLQVSGVCFKFDPSSPPGSRVLHDSVVVEKGGIYVPLKLDETFRLCTKNYLALGKDGFDVLKECPVLMDAEDCQNLPTMVRNSFSLAAIANGYRKPHCPQTLRRLDTFMAMSCDAQKKCCGMTKQPKVIVPSGPGPLFQLSCSVEGRIINIAKE